MPGLVWSTRTCGANRAGELAFLNSVVIVYVFHDLDPHNIFEKMVQNASSFDVYPEVCVFLVVAHLQVELF